MASVLALVFLVHALAMMAFEGLAFEDALWLTLTTATTVGYGDYSAETALGRWTTTLCLYMFGIYLLAQVASDLIDFRVLSRERRRRGEHRWSNMKHHLLIINVPANDTDRYLERFVRHVRETPSLGDVPIQILTDRFPNGLPNMLVEQGVTHFTGVAESTENLMTANAAFAAQIVVIANDASDTRSDAYTFDILSRIQSVCKSLDTVMPTIVAESVDDVNRKRMLEAGASTVVRPVRAYPEFMVRSLAEPGTEKVIENLFTHDSDRLVRFDAPFDRLKWGDVIVGFVRSGVGVPMGFFAGKHMDTNPSPSAICTGDGIIVLQDESQHATLQRVLDCLAVLQRNLPAA